LSFPVAATISTPSFRASFAARSISVSTKSADGNRLQTVVVDVSGKGEQAGTRSLLLSGAFGGLLGALPAERFGSASAIHKRFLEWQKAGVFEALWKAGLAEYDDLEGIAWRWQSIDGAMMKAPLAQEAVGPNPTDRGKKWEQASSAGGRPWRPAVDHRNRSQST